MIHSKDWLWVPPSSYSTATKGSLAKIKVAEHDHWPPHSAKMKNKWSYTFTPPCLHMDRDNYYLSWPVTQPSLLKAIMGFLTYLINCPANLVELSDTRIPQEVVGQFWFSGTLIHNKDLTGLSNIFHKVFYTFCWELMYDTYTKMLLCNSKYQLYWHMIKSNLH